MPSDVNLPDDSSSPDPRKTESQSETNEIQMLSPELQDLAEKPEVQQIMDRLGAGESDPDEVDNNTNEDEDEEAASSDDKADAEEKADDKADTDEAENANAEEADKADDAEVADEADEAEKDDAEETDDADDKAEPEPEKKKTPEAKPEDQDPTEEELRQMSRNENARIRSLVKRRKAAEAEVAKREERIAELEHKAAYRDSLDTVLKTNGISQEAWDQWQDLGLLMQTEPQRAAILLNQMSKSLGYQEITDSTPVSKLDDDLTKMVADTEMTKEAAEKIQRQRMRDAQMAVVRQPRKTQVPQQRQQQQHQPDTTQRSQASQLPRLSQSDLDRGAAAVKAVNAEFAKKYPDQWASMVPEVDKLMKTYQGTPPHLWGKIARDCAEKVVAKRTAKSVVTRRPDPTMRATSGGGTRSSQRNSDGPAKNLGDLADRVAEGTRTGKAIRR